MSYLHYLCLFANSGVQRTLCWVFVFLVFVLCTLCCQFLWIVYFSLSFRLVYPMLPVSLDCLFFIVLSVFSNVYVLSRNFIYIFVNLIEPCSQYGPCDIIGNGKYTSYYFVFVRLRHISYNN